MIERISVDCGFRLEENGEIIGYELDTTLEGKCYKDKKAFESGVGICYIGESEGEMMQEELSSLSCEYDQNEDMSEEEYRENIKGILKGYGWKRKDFINLVGGDGYNGYEKVAQYVFENVNWQSPEVYWNEYEFEPADLVTFGLTWEQVEKDWGIKREDYGVVRKKTITDKEAEARLIASINNIHFEDEVYTLVHDMFMGVVEKINEEFEVVGADGTPYKENDEEQWYDGTRESDIREDFFTICYQKMLDFLTRS